MEWSKGFSSTYYACIVDPDTWRDMDRFYINADSKINRSDTALIEAADVLTDYAFEGEKWIRLYMDVRQNGATEHVALFTGIAAAPSQDVFWLKSKYALECYSVLKPAEDVLLPRGYYVPAEADSGQTIQSLFGVTPAPVEVLCEMPAITNAIIAEQAENHLSMVQKVLQAVNRRIRIMGNGTIQICEKASAPTVTYDPLSNDAVEPQLAMTHDWFSCPNVFRAVANDASVTVYDDRETSALSTVNRGREVWMEEDNCTLNVGEGLHAYAERRLFEEQARGYELSYSRRYHPDITIGDIVGLRYPENGINGDYKVITQSITLGKGCRTEEECEYC